MKILDIGFQVYLKDPDIFCVSLLGEVIAIDRNLVTVRTGVYIKGTNIHTVKRDKVYMDEEQVKCVPPKRMKEAMEKMKVYFDSIAK